MDTDGLREFFDNLSKWIKFNCYLGFIWVFVDILPLLPVHIADRIIEGLLRKLGV